MVAKKRYFAFVFLGGAEGCDPDKEKKVVETPTGGCVTIPVHDYDQAIEVCKKLDKEDLFAIELCGGFGHLGTARIVDAVGGKVPVGVVRFDIHPLLGGKGRRLGLLEDRPCVHQRETESTRSNLFPPGYHDAWGSGEPFKGVLLLSETAVGWSSRLVYDTSLSF